MQGFLDWQPMALTLRVALISTALATVAGVCIAYALSSWRFPGRALLEALSAFPLVLPPTVLGYWLLAIFGRGTTLGRWYESLFGQPLVFTWQGAVLAAVIPSVPFVIRTSRAAFDQVDSAMLDAARIDGASQREQFLRILLPLGRPGIFAGAALAFARSVGEFGATLMVAGNIPGRTQTASIAIYDALQAGQTDRAGAMALALTLAAAAILWLAGRWERRGLT